MQDRLLEQAFELPGDVRLERLELRVDDDVLGRATEAPFPLDGLGWEAGLEAAAEALEQFGIAAVWKLEEILDYGANLTALQDYLTCHC